EKEQKEKEQKEKEQKEKEQKEKEQKEKEPPALGEPLTQTDEKTQEVQELNPRQAELLEKLKTMKKITRKEYSVLFNISVPTAARDLKELVDKNLLQAKGPLGPGRWYELIS
ncbi:MAG: DeoR family transcriptional regulator, partial [Candidatus Omnitrophica bacterium]|nr:DeoR family transcriptional regulator [Candidatus Omnitrophota bacterium]